MTLSGGSLPFLDDYIVEFTVDPVGAIDEFSGSITLSQIVVYASVADFAAGTPTYTYLPQNPGQTVGIQNSVDGIVDTYVRFNANVLVSSDPSAPQLSTLFVAPGSNVANETSFAIDHHTDVDLNENTTIDGGTVEDGNGYFNTGGTDLNSPVCFAAGTLIDTPQGAKPIETLRIGDEVLTKDSGAQKIVWIGTQTRSVFAKNHSETTPNINSQGRFRCASRHSCFQSTLLTLERP